MPQELDNLELRSEEVQEVLGHIPSWMIRYGSMLFFAVILLFILLTWFIKYPDIISSEAIITTPIPPQKEYSKLNAKIEHLFVKNNEFITAGKPIAILENPANYSDVFFLKTILDSVETRKDSFIFPMNELPILFLGDLELRFAEFQNDYIQYNQYNNLQPYLNKQKADRVTERELQRRILVLKNQIEINKKELSLKKRELERFEKLFQKNVISSQDYEQKELAFLNAAKTIENLSLSLSQYREGLGKAKNQSRANSIDKNMEELRLLKTVLQSFNQLRKSIKEWELKYTFQSNINGYVTFINARSENQAVNTGDLLFIIIPENKNKQFIAKLKSPSQNSGKIQIGQLVNIKLQNYPEPEYGILRGKVENISLATDEDGYYLIDVSLPNKLTTSYNKDIEFKQEMRGSADIITEDLSLLERFLYQFKKSISR